MSVPLNIVNLSSTASSGTSGAGAGIGKAAAAAGKAAAGQGNGFQDLLTMLLDLLAATAASSGEATTGSDADAAAATTIVDATNENATLDLGGIVNLQALLAAAQAKSGNSDTTSETSDSATSDADSSDGSDTADPLAAILDILIAALQNATAANPEGDALTLDGKSSDTLKALNALLASLSGDKPATPTPAAPTPLPSDILDKLKALDQLLSSQGEDPQLAELKTRIADLIGKGTTNDAAKASTSDATTQSVAALLGQSGADKSSGNAQRDVMTHVLDGARTALHADTSTSDAGSGGSSGQNQSQARPQTSQSQSAARQPATGAGFAAQLIADSKDASPKSETATDPAATLPAQGLDRIQQMQFRTIPSAYTQAGNRVDLPQIAFEIARHASNGINRFQIRLDPPEMGRIDVRLDVDHTGGLSARLTVDRQDTLDMLQRDARALERALAQTGLDSGKTNLEFSLRQNPFARQDFSQDQGNSTPSWLSEIEDASAGSADPAPTPAIYYRGAIRPGGINLVA